LEIAVYRIALPFLVLTLLVLTMSAAAQNSGGDMKEQSMSMAGTQMPGMRTDEMQMPDMQMSAPSSLPSPHAGSGTAWESASVPAHEWMLMRSGWMLMAHGELFIDYNQQGSPRGEGKAESVNWGMLMEQHKLGKGTILFRQMSSAESLTSPHPGFPELFQTGETYHGEPLVDHQHPHNVVAELSFLYTLPLAKKI
jgi:hypothetical protein